MRQANRHSPARVAVSGSTLIEAMIACAIVALFFGAIYAGGCQSLHMLKSATEGVSAGQTLMNLEEQVRTSTWANLTTPSYISGTILGSSTPVGHLTNVTQTIVINPYPLPTGYTGTPAIGSQTVEVTCNSSGVVSTPYSGNSGLSADSAIRVDITVGWTTVFNRIPHTRMVSLVITNGGVLGQN